jgi:anti-sigma factor RsiW
LKERIGRDIAGGIAMSKESANDCPSDDTLYAYVDGALTRTERRRWRRHIAHCARCEAAMASSRELAEWAGPLKIASLNDPHARRAQRWFAAVRQRLHAHTNEGTK